MKRALLLIGVVLCGCGGSTDSCPNDLPSACMMPVPSYANDIAPIFANRCTKCHSPTGQEPSVLLVDYAHVDALHTEVLTQVYGCRMPPAGETPPTPAERAQLLDWLVCGAPNN